MFSIIAAMSHVLISGLKQLMPNILCAADILVCLAYAIKIMVPVIPWLSSGDIMSLMHPRTKWLRLLVVGCRLSMLMSCLSEGDQTPWSNLDGLRLSLLSKVKMSTLNCLTAMVSYLRPLFFELPQKIIFSANFCPLSRPRVMPTAELSGYTHVHFYFYEARCFDELSRGSFSCLDLK